MEAIKNGNKEMINLLLDSGAHVTPAVERALADPKNSNYDNEMFKAILQILLDRGWDINKDGAIMYVFFFFLPTFHIANRVYSSAQISSATSEQNEVLANFLLTHGADPNVTSVYHFTPLSIAAKIGSLAYIELLFSHGAKPDHYALHMAVRRRKSDSSRFPILALLFSHGADINALETGMRGRPTSNALKRSPHPSTVLDMALSTKDVGMVRFLIEQGADPKLANRNEAEKDLSSLEAVRLSKNEEIVRAVLEEANSKLKEPAQENQPRYAFRKRK